MNREQVIYSILMIAVMGLVTLVIRALPFVVFKKGTPRIIRYLGVVLPCAVMAMLVVFCLRNVSVTEMPYGLPELLALGAVFGLHKWKHNQLVSIAGGTAVYMVLIRVIPLLWG